MKSKYILVFGCLFLAVSCSQTANLEQSTGALRTSTVTKPAPSGSSDNQEVGDSKVTPTPVDELAGLGSNKYANGILPLGDYKYVTNGPKKGYVYLCRAQTGGGGAQVDGSWISGNSWDINKKISVQGSVAWENAAMTVKTSGSNRIITLNDLPLKDTSGTFPVASSDPAYQVDRNPNSIKTQSFTFTLPSSPSQTTTPNCIGGEVGVMLSGVVLFNAFDSEGRDAAAHEVQDHCQAHPQEGGVYHYHSLSSCIKNDTVDTVIGYAFDGFPITGSKISENKYLNTEDLDECHGLTSTINIDGQKLKTYHYVMTEDFPYSISCFRGKSTQNTPLGGARNQSAGQQSGQNQNLSQLPGSSAGGAPPQVAIDACSGKTVDSSCTVKTPNGNLSGTCKIPPNQSLLACIPNN